jgi:hypothetical protein
LFWSNPHTGTQTTYWNPDPDPHTGTRTHIPEHGPRPTYRNPDPHTRTRTQTHILEPKPTYPNLDPDPHTRTWTQTHIFKPGPRCSSMVEIASRLTMTSTRWDDKQNTRKHQSFCLLLFLGRQVRGMEWAAPPGKPVWVKVVEVRYVDALCTT